MVSISVQPHSARGADAIPLRFAVEIDPEIASDLANETYGTPEALRLRIEAARISLLDDFNTLLCLEHLPRVEKLWYQIESVRKTLRHFNGRVLLADEVGLGKTIEAGMLIKEYLLRGLAEKVLIITPPSLVSQWREEMAVKFGLECAVARPRSPASFWLDEPRIITSINTAKSAKRFVEVVAPFYDLVVVDEAHHLKNRASLNWKLVNALQKRYIFLLTATPVANSLLELYNLVTLLKPGHLKTERQFKSEFVSRGDLTAPKNKESLRSLLSEVMIRNTRALVGGSLPRRWAHTFIVEPAEDERNFYERLSTFVRECFEGARAPRGEGLPLERIERMTLATLQKEAGSSREAVLKTLGQLLAREDRASVVEREALEALRIAAESIRESAKADKLMEIIKQNSREKVLVFVQYRSTLGMLTERLASSGVHCVEFHGGLSAEAKDSAVSAFRDDADVLIATESGGEGRNLQFCHTMVNYDLPWNPMRIEQRIGRIHRFGQEHDVFIFNLALRGSVEDYLLAVLDRKINMFELVIGEMDMILGNLTEAGREFEEIVLDRWVRGTEERLVKKEFDTLGEELVAAKERYIASRALDEKLFAEDYQL
jgi:SNF2 family DNA or RNA helicase